MPLTSSIQYLYSLQSFGMKFGLRNIRTLLRSCGDPHTHLRTVHVAGTNGKGSTSSMIASVMTAAGYNVGLYTSPHLVSFNERIRINGRPIPAARLASYVKRLRPVIDRHQATFFEATTAIAFRYFADEKVDIAVIETGLGGRLDSTNVITPLVSVITTIGKDHEQILGSTLRSIASEKAGIIKRRVPVVIGEITGIPRSVIIDKALSMHAPLIESRFMALPLEITLDLPGDHQKSNARTALSAIAQLAPYFLIGDNAVRKGLEQTSALAGLRGRFEMRRGSPTMIFDAAHNPDGMRVLVPQLKRLPHRKKILLFAVMKDKDLTGMVEALRSLPVSVVCTRPTTERALEPSAAAAAFVRSGHSAIAIPNVSAALRRARAMAGKRGAVIVCGSHYLLGEVLGKVEKTP